MKRFIKTWFVGLLLAPVISVGLAQSVVGAINFPPSYAYNKVMCTSTMLGASNVPDDFLAMCANNGVIVSKFYDSIKDDTTGQYKESARTYCGNKAVISPAKAPMDFAAFCSNKAGGNTQLFGKNGILTIIINVALYFIGGISVLMLIIGGVRYTMSAGDEKSVTAAKSTILYAVIGVVVSLLAYAIINFVMSTFKA